MRGMASIPNSSRCSSRSSRVGWNQFPVAEVVVVVVVVVVAVTLAVAVAVAVVVTVAAVERSTW